MVSIAPITRKPSNQNQVQIQEQDKWNEIHHFPDSKVHGANMGPTWVLSAPDGTHDGPMNLAIWLSLSHLVAGR